MCSYSSMCLNRSLTESVSVSRNGFFRHGLAAAIVNAPGMSAETNRLAQAICGSDAGPAQREQAQIIAECELLLLRVRAARVEIFEELSLKAPGNRSDNHPFFRISKMPHLASSN
jgi:hypothetical protein